MIADKIIIAVLFMYLISSLFKLICYNSSKTFNFLSLYFILYFLL